MVGSAVATAATNLTQCVTTTETVSRARYWNAGGPRSGSERVGRTSAQLLTCLTEEPIYAPTPGAPMTVDSTDLPLSEARIAAMPAGSWGDSHALPVETQGAFMAVTGTTAAATLGDADTAAQSSVLDHSLLEYGLQALPDVSHSTRTQHQLGSPTLPTTPSQLEQVDILKAILAIANAASEPRLAQSLPQAIDPQTGSAQLNDLEPTNAGYNTKNDNKDDPPPTGTQGTEDGKVSPADLASEAFRSSQENNPDTPMDPAPVVAADDALKPLTISKLRTATPIPTSTTIQTRTLAPGSIISFGSAHLSVLPDASGLTLSNGSTLRLKDGDTAEIKLPDGPTLQVSRSGTVYLVDARTADMTPQLTGTSSNGASDPARTPEQTTGGDIGSSHGGIQVSFVSTATDGPTNHIAGEISTGGAALVCPSDVRGLMVGMLLFVLICWINK